MEYQVKFGSPQNISGVSQENSVAAFSEKTDVDGDVNLSPSRYGDWIYSNALGYILVDGHMFTLNLL